jgi:protein-S-isoprenylcysteine O-methyltransferase Ste14
MKAPTRRISEAGPRSFRRARPASPGSALCPQQADRTRGPGPATRGQADRAPWLDRVARALVNVLGAAGAALFARASLQYYLHTHSLIGGVFLIEQTWFVAAFLARRPPRAVSRHLGSWLFAAGGTYGGVLFRPGGAHPRWGVETGLGLQVLGLAIAITSLLALGRSFGFVAADRGLVTRGPYAIVRHPVYAAYLLIQSGYLLQSISLRNVFVLVFANACNVGRALAEERVFAGSPDYEPYRNRVRWRLLPGLW